MEQAYYEIDQFPKLARLCKNWKIIKAEYEKLEAPIMKIHRNGKVYDQVLSEVIHYINEGNEYGWVLGWGATEGNHDWLQYGLIFRDQIVPFVHSEMEQTVAMFKHIKGVKMCALATLNPYTVLHTHQHPVVREEGLLQLHLPIATVPHKNYNYLNVQGEFRQHVCGEPIVFDGSLDHFALNESADQRTILYIEFDKKSLMTDREFEINS